MRNAFWLASTAIVAASILAVPAYAGGKTKQDLRDQEIQELRARLDRLEREAEDEKIQMGSRLNKVEETQNAVQWSFSDARPTIRTGDGRFEMSLRGRFQIDFAHFDQDQSDFGAGYGAVGACATTNVLCDLGNGAVFRRVRFGIEGKFFRDFIYEMRFDFGGTDVEGTGAVNIMRVGYIGIPHLRIHAGAIQPIVTLYDATSSAEKTTMENAQVVDTIKGPFGFDNARRGIEATFQYENFLWDGDNFLLSGAFTGNRTTSLGGCQSATHSGGPDDECTQLVGRTAYRLWSDGVSNIQIGASGAQILSLQGQAAGGARNLRFRERPEIRVTGERFVDTGDMASDDATMYGFEFGANFMNFYLAAEYYEWEVDRIGATLDPEFSGWYVEGEWILTGENKRYSASGTNNNVAVWRGPSVASPWSLGGGTGAWSIHARHSVLDLNFNEGVAGAATPAGGVRGGEQTITNVGLTWYLNANLKTYLEYSMVDIERLNAAGASLDAEFDVIQGRAMFTF
jgi:phosphate-selective porin OprO/OprP